MSLRFATFCRDDPRCRRCQRKESAPEAAKAIMRPRLAHHLQRGIGLAAILAAAVLLAGCTGDESGSAVDRNVVTKPESTAETLDPRAGSAGPQVPPCGTVEIDSTQRIAGIEFAAGSYVIHAFGITCAEVLGDGGVFGEFLRLEDDDPLPAPWQYLAGAVGAPKFVRGPSAGFRVQQIGS